MKTIEEYYNLFEPAIVDQLHEMHQIIQEVLPEAQEVISYSMPAFKTSEVLVYYAAAKKHIGFYPTTTPIVAFEEQLKPYKHSKGSVQFPYNKPLPKELIQAMVLFRKHEVETQNKK